jgi:hemerythrin-like domain-containing protein
MKRSEHLIPLSHDHHVALVVANRLKSSLNQFDQKDALEYWEEIRGQYKQDLLKHFEVEENELLPLLDGVSEKASMLAINIIADHTKMRNLLSSHDLSAAVEFAELLKKHVRFEERELFPWLEIHCDLALLTVIH